jgi:hypothetical protein
MTYRANWCPGLEDRRIRTQYLLIINSVINLFKNARFSSNRKARLGAGFAKRSKVSRGGWIRARKPGHERMKMLTYRLPEIGISTAIHL